MSETPKTSPSGLGRWGPMLIVGVCLLAYFLVTRPAGALTGWSDDFESAVATARVDEKNLLLAFHSKHCPPCVTMERTVLGEQPVVEMLEDVVPVRIDLYQRADLGTRFGVFATPTYVVLTPEGDVLGLRMGYIPTNEFIAFVSGASSRAKSTRAAANP